jgi:predicted MPP superfamily phosphohydrolase
MFLASSFIAGRFLERVWLSPMSDVLVWIGSFWLAAMMYLLLAVVVIDVVRLLQHLFSIFPADLFEMLLQRRLWLGLAVATVVGVLLLAGYLNARNPRIRTVDIPVKKLPGDSTMTIALASDIHLGTIIGRHQLDRIVDLVLGPKPDLILLAGDIIDEDLAPVLAEDVGDHLRALQAPLGVIACTGNHEFIGGVEEAVHYLREHGVTVLRDSVVTLANGVQVVGRDDRSSAQFAGTRRMPLRDLMQGVDRSRPVILMDHQPFGLSEAAEAGVDLQVSGHTHHGQLWPANLITSAIYEVSWGLARIGGTHVYVSSGVGTWGPPVRLGNVPEIVLLRLRSAP